MRKITMLFASMFVFGMMVSMAQADGRGNGPVTSSPPVKGPAPVTPTVGKSGDIENPSDKEKPEKYKHKKHKHCKHKGKHNDAHHIKHKKHNNQAVVCKHD